MDIRIPVVISMIAAALMVNGCASSEETRPASGPSMKEVPSATTRETPPPTPMAKEPAATAPTKETTRPSDSRTALQSNPLQACLDAAAKGATPGQRSMAEQTCHRDFGTNDPRAVASGTQGDTLQSCLARIPKDATMGQRMIAEQGCQRDEELRKGF